MDFSSYDVGFWDEMFAGPGALREHARLLGDRLASLADADLARRRTAAERSFLHRGITFNVYGEAAGKERIFPFDLVPRVVGASEWRTIERGLAQRIRALNLFLGDVYGPRRIVRAGVVPEEVIASAKGYLPACEGFVPPKGVYCHVVGTDLVRDKDGQIYVLGTLRAPRA